MIKTLRTYNKQKLNEPITYKEYEHRYYQENKDRINNYSYQYIKCDACGHDTMRSKISRHKKSNKCAKIAKQNNKPDITCFLESQ